ncbi:L,D-transpeptidase [Thiotrichales bacterium HSG1]|nr:L,D-transpeptidase [Thiotrichales bacterium HSG1]
MYKNLKIFTYILFLSAIGVLESACLQDSSQVPSDKNSPKSIKEVPKPESTTPKITPTVQVVREFYTAINKNDCITATKIRADYTTQQCRNIANIYIKDLHSVSKNAVCLHIQYKHMDRKKIIDFKGILTLDKEDDGWSIAGSDSYELLNTKEYGEKCTTSPVAKKEFLPPKDSSNPCYQQNETIIIVDVSEQKLHLCDREVKTVSYPVSTAKRGIGSRAGSNKTPLGYHQIAEKIGYNAPKLTIFKARINTGNMAILNAKNAGDLVTSRIMWLKGLEKGKNSGVNVDSYKRYIYIHGTAEEYLIGTPASHGCVRMLNDDVIRLFEQVEEKTKVYIRE